MERKAGLFASSLNLQCSFSGLLFILLQFIHSDRHVNNLLKLPYCNELASDLGVLPSFPRLLWQMLQAPARGWQILRICYTRAPTASQYRPFGPGSYQSLAEGSVLKAAESSLSLSMAERVELSRLRHSFKVQLVKI